MTDFVNTVSATEFDSGHEFVKGVLIERDPALDLSSGSALDGLLVEQEAHLAALHQSRLDQLANASSLQAIVDGLVTVADADVDKLVSNYGITRQGDTAASGPVRIIVTTPIPYQIPAGFTFTFNSLTFETANAFRVYPPDSVGVTDTADSRRMVERSDGTFEFTITVTANDTGSASQLAAGSVVVIDNPLAGMSQATVASDFTGGEDRETNEEMLARAAAGVTAKVLAGPEHIQATVANEFAGATCAVVGIGSELMTRDRGNLFGLSTGGKQDIYCKTSAYVRSKTLTVNGTVIDAASKRVLLDIPYTDGVGVYRVIAIRKAGLVALDGDQPVSAEWSTWTQTLYMPTIVSPKDAAFSANGKLQVVFIDTTTPGAFTINQVNSYDVDMVYMPSIEAVNTFLTDDDLRPAGQDILVKAGIPCTVSCAATVRIPTNVAQPTVAELRTAISDAINALPFNTPSLAAYVVHRAISSIVTKGDVINTVLRGLIYSPEGTDINLPASGELVIPTDGTLGVGPANVFFSCAPEQVELTIVSR